MDKATAQMILALPNVQAITPYGDYMIVIARASRFRSVVLQIDNTGAVHRHLGSVLLITPRAVTVTNKDAMYIVNGGLPGFYGLGFILKFKMGYASWLRLPLESLMANMFAYARLAVFGAVLFFQSVIRRMKKLLNKEILNTSPNGQKQTSRTFDKIKAATLELVRERRFGRCVSWPTDVCQIFNTDDLLITLSRGLYRCPSDQVPLTWQTVADGFLNVVSLSCRGGTKYLVCEQDLFRRELLVPGKFGFGLGAIWEVDLLSGSRLLVVGGLSDPRSAVLSTDGCSVVLLARDDADGKHKLMVYGLKNRLMNRSMDAFKNPTTLQYATNGEIFLGDASGVYRIQPIQM